MINIVCLKWGTKYSAEYVNRLHAMIRRNTTKDIRFYCLTDDDLGINPAVKIILLPYAKKIDSWWNKIWLFSQDLPLATGEQIFYVDLDTLIVNNIDELLTEDVPDIILLKDFYHGIARTAGLIGSGLMSWKHGQYKNIWEKFIENPERAVEQANPHGDQWWVEKNIDAWYFWQDLFPGRVVSFKMHCADSLPNNASIICYHGRPSIPESITQSMHHSTSSKKWTTHPAPWVLEHWRDD